MLNFTATVQKLAVVSGTPTQNLEAGLRQLGQAMSSNIVRAEEFNSVLENIPAIANLAAQGVGLTVGQLRLLVIEGKLTSEDLFKILSAGQKVVELQSAQFEKNNILQLSFNQLRTSAMNYLDSLNQTYGVTKFISTILKELAENIDLVARALVGGITGFLVFSGLMNAGKVLAFAGAVATMATPLGAAALAVGAATATIITFRNEIAATLPWMDRFFGMTQKGRVESLQRGIAGLEADIARLDGGDVSFIEKHLMTSRRAKVKMLENLRDDLASISPEVAGSGGAFGPFLPDSERAKIEIQNAIKAMQQELEQSGISGKLQGLLSGLGDKDESAKKFASAVKAAEGALRGVLKPAEEYALSLENINEMAKSGALAQAAQNLGLSEAEAKTRLADQALKDLNDTLMQDTIRLAEDLKDAFSSAFEEAVLGGKSLSDVLKSLEKDLMRLLLHEATKGFFDTGGGGGAGGGFFNMLAGGIGSLFGTGGSAAGYEEIAWNQGGSSLIPKFASGGSFTVGGRGGIDQNTLSLNGRPVAKVSMGDEVVVNNKAQQSSGGVSIVMNITTPDADSFKRSQGQILRDAQAAASRAMRRNG